MLPCSLFAVGSSSLACPWNPTVDPPVKHLSQVSIVQATTEMHTHYCFLFCATKPKAGNNKRREGGRRNYNYRRIKKNQKKSSPFQCSMFYVCSGKEGLKKQEKKQSSLSVFLFSLFSSQSVGRLVSLTALLPLLHSFLCSPFQRSVMST